MTYWPAVQAPYTNYNQFKSYYDTYFLTAAIIDYFDLKIVDETRQIHP